MEGRPHPCSAKQNPGKRQKVGGGPRGRARGPQSAESKMPWEGIPPGVCGVRGRARGLSWRTWGQRAPRGRSSRSRIQGPCSRAGARKACIWRERVVNPRSGRIALSWGLGSCGSESQFRGEGMEDGQKRRHISSGA